MAHVLDAVVGEPETAVAVEDEVVRSDQARPVRLLVQDLDLAGVEVDSLDAAALVRGRRLMRDGDAAHVDEAVGGAVVADVQLPIRSELRAVRATPRLGDRLLAAVFVDPSDPLALDLADDQRSVRQHHRPLRELESLRQNTHLSHPSPPRSKSTSGWIRRPPGRGT